MNNDTDQNTITLADLNWVKNQDEYFAILDQFLASEITAEEFYERKAALIAN